MVKTLSAMQETQVQFLGSEDPLENGLTGCLVLHYSCLESSMDRGGRQVSPRGPKELDTTEQLTLSLI